MHSNMRRASSIAFARAFQRMPILSAYHIVGNMCSMMSLSPTYFSVSASQLYTMTSYIVVLFAWFLVRCFLFVQADSNEKPFNLVVVCTFKNESMILESWLQHYIREGVDHFYLLDNGSQDDYMRIMQHLPGNMVTLVRDNSPPRMALQDFLMNKYFTSLIVTDARWVMVVDVDEYVYPMDSNSCIADVLAGLPSDISRVFMPWKVFGSNGHILQPEVGIVRGFTKRARVNIKRNQHMLGNGKTITRVTSRLHLLTHSSYSGNSSIFYSDGQLATFGESTATEHITEETIRSHPLQLNHYMYQSREYYKTVKCSRGGGQSGHIKKYTMEYFDAHEPDTNQLEDLGLLARYESRKRICASNITSLR